MRRQVQNRRPFQWPTVLSGTTEARKLKLSFYDSLAVMFPDVIWVPPIRRPCTELEFHHFRTKRGGHEVCFLRAQIKMGFP